MERQFQATQAATRDKAGRPVIAVTGMGIVTSLGVGKDDNWAKLSDRQIRHPAHFALSARQPAHHDRRHCRRRLQGLHAAGGTVRAHRDCWPAKRRSRKPAIGSKGHFPGPLFLALPPLEIEWHYRIQMAEKAVPDSDAGYPDLMRVAREPQFSPIYETLKYGIIGEHLAEHFGTEGSPISLTTACASGATAIQLGVEAIRRGECKAALALGADGSITPESLVRFSLLSALSTQNDPPEQASKPFSKNRDGFVLAEGAGALVLEDYDYAVARGAKVLGILEGCGEKSDSFHRTRSSPDGKPVIACMRNALADAGVGPQDVDYINAHGTSTPENDKMESPRRLHGVRRAHPQHSDVVEQIDDRPHVDRRRRGGSGVHRSDA